MRRLPALFLLAAALVALRPVEPRAGGFRFVGIAPSHDGLVTFALTEDGTLYRRYTHLGQWQYNGTLPGAPFADLACRVADHGLTTWMAITENGRCWENHNQVTGWIETVEIDSGGTGARFVSIDGTSLTEAGAYWYAVADDGRWWWMESSAWFQGEGNIDGGFTSVEPSTWGQIKARQR